MTCVGGAPDCGGDPRNANPEQALASALSSRQTMTFIALAAEAKWPVATYRVCAVVPLGKNSKGRMSVTRVDLHPVVGFDIGFAADETTMQEMHDRAHC